MKKLVMLLAVVVSFACSSEDKTLEKVLIYFIPFEAETYVPITPKNIEESANLIGSLALTDRRFRKLRKLLESSPAGEIDRIMLRAKIVLPDNGVIFIDKYGGVQLPEKEPRKLKNSDFRTVKRILEKVTCRRLSGKITFKKVNC